MPTPNTNNTSQLPMPFMTIQYAIKNGTTFDRRLAMIPREIQPQFRKVYEFVLQRCSRIRALIALNSDANFLLLNRSLQCVGYFCVDITNMTDAQLACIACYFMAFEGLTLEFQDPTTGASVFGHA
jgi:hypothetical protein